ncbi:MAG: galactitol-1-phosphate 5-dehydrogenase [Erysipelothrix sp.]|nr:galactitol-1-phosphate 5-dehydrogenase [Erysipelothrix sp.]
MKAARLHKIGDFRIDDVEVPVPQNDQILIKVGACGICGSDLPRVYELGTSKQKYPLTIGHEFGGEIVAVGQNVDESNIGKKGAIFPCIPCMKCEMCTTGNYAMCLDYDYLGSRRDGGFAEYCLVPSMWHFVESSKEVSYESLAMVEPCTVAQHCLRKSKLSAGNSILIFGAGPIGIMCARWAKIFGASTIILIDVNEEKIKFSQDRDLVCLDGRREDLYEELLRLNNGKKFDVVVEGVGAGVTLNQCVETVRTFGTIVMMGNPHQDTTIKLKTHSNILRKELNIVGMWNSHYHPLPINEWHYTVEQLETGRMSIDDLVTHSVGIEQVVDIFDDVYNQRMMSSKVLYRSDLK